jgi:RNA 2',3'-cyclic 3'-phosphodiesterase
MTRTPPKKVSLDGERAASPRVRLFVAAELPEAVREALVAWRPSDDGLRPVAADGLHVTLCFLGWRDDGAVERIGAAMAACAAPVGELAVGAALWLPPRRPRVLAVELDDPQERLGALAASVVRAMVGAAGHEPEKRPFLPHVTVARVRRGARAPAGDLDPPRPLRFTPTALTLFRSHLGSAGARYEGLVSVRLPDTGERQLRE